MLPPQTEKKTLLSNYSKEQQSSKFCYFYIIILFGVYSLFYINLKSTLNAFDENEYLPSNPDVLCRDYVEELNICLSKISNLKDKTECNEFNFKVETCYDSVMRINKHCGVYLSEYSICRKKSIICNGILDDIKECVEIFRTSSYLDVSQFLN